MAEKSNPSDIVRLKSCDPKMIATRVLDGGRLAATSWFAASKHKKKRGIVLLVLIASLCIAPIVLAGDVTMEQFKELKMGMPYKLVVKIIGPPDQELSRSAIGGIETVMYEWKGKVFMGAMNAMFQNGKLVTKSQLGLK